MFNFVWKPSQPIGGHPLTDTLCLHIAWKYKLSQPIGDHPLWPRPLRVVSNFVRHSHDICGWRNGSMGMRLLNQQHIGTLSFEQWLLFCEWTTYIGRRVGNEERGQKNGVRFVQPHTWKCLYIVVMCIHLLFSIRLNDIQCMSLHVWDCWLLLSKWGCIWFCQFKRPSLHCYPGK